MFGQKTFSRNYVISHVKYSVNLGQLNGHCFICSLNNTFYIFHTRYNCEVIKQQIKNEKCQKFI